MTGLLLIAHTPLASALRAACLHAYPEAGDAVVACDIDPGDDAERCLALARDALAGLPDGERLVLSDVFGATPCNVARRLADECGLRLLVGMNLPMLWRALNYRNRPLDEVVALALAGATQGVMQLTATRPQNQAQAPAPHDPIHGHHQQ